MTTIICPHCGKDIPEDALHCGNCGAALEAPPPIESAPETPAHYAPVKKRTPTWWKVLRCLFSVPLTAVLTAALPTTLALFAAHNLTPANAAVAQLFTRYPTAADLLAQISPVALLAAVGGCVLLFTLLALLNLRGFYLTSLYSGIPLLLGGMAATTALGCNTFAVNYLAALVPTLPQNALESAVQGTSAILWIPGLCMVAIGTLCIVLFGVKRTLRRLYGDV